MKKLGLGILITLIIAVVITNTAFALPSLSLSEGKSKLTKKIFIRYAPGKDPACDNDGACEPGENWKKCPNDCSRGDKEEPNTKCYGFLVGSKPRWNWTEDYYTESGLGATSGWATNKWDEVTAADIFGEGHSGSSVWGVYDDRNAIVYGDYPNPDVVAVTAIWYQGKNIYEYDIMFDTDYFPNKGYDLDTVSLHEFGHAAGLKDLYKSDCQDNVMYGYYIGPKTTFGTGDITGIQNLYGTPY